MKLWNVSKIQRRQRKEATLKSLARILRDWLDGFVKDSGSVHGREDRESTSIAAPPSISSAGNQSHGSETGSTSGTDERAGVPPWRSLQQPAPPEDWLRRVREGAPELLRTLEQGGTPWSIAPQAAIGNFEPQRGTDSSPATPLHSHKASDPGLMARTIAGSRPSPAAAPRLNQQERSLTPGGARRKATVVTPTPSDFQHEPAGESRGHLRQESHSVTIESEPLAASRTHREASARSRWTERVGRRILAVLPAGAMTPPVSKAQTEKDNVKNETKRSDIKKVLPRIAETPSPSPASVSKVTTDLRSNENENVDRVSSGTPAPFLYSDQPSVRSSQFSGASRQKGDAKNGPGVWTNSRRGTPLAASARQHKGQWPESAGADVFQGEQDHEEQIATQPVDPWPALPEEDDVRRAPIDWPQFSRNAERLRALDLEQRGGR